MGSRGPAVVSRTSALGSDPYADILSLAKLADKYGKLFAKDKLKTSDVFDIFVNFFSDAIGLFPSDARSANSTVSAQIGQLGTDLEWYVNTIDTSDHLDEILGDLQTSVQQVQQFQANPTNENLRFTTASAAFALANEHVRVLKDDNHFLRKYRTLSPDIRLVIPASDLTDIQPVNIPEDPGGQWTYDWRVELPRMMAGITASVAILAAADNGYTLSTVRDELTQHYNTLAYHYNRMFTGVKCNTYDDVDPTQYRPNGVVLVVCADIHAGTFEELDFPHGNIDNQRDACKICISNGSGGCEASVFPTYGYDQQCLADLDAQWATYWNNIYATEEQLRRKVLQKMPLFELRSLMNTIYLYANPAPDLTEMQQRIATKYYGQYCLDVQNGNSASGTPIWMWPCSGSGNGAQRWQYKRSEGTIVNAWCNKCMDVQLDQTTQLWEPILNDCNGSDSQRWSFDPVQNVLYNGSNPTNALKAATTQGGFPYLDWKDETPGSLWGYFLDPYWEADSVDPCTTQPPLATGADSCSDQICSADSYCCNTYWDGLCVAEVGSVCGRSCPPPS